MLEILPKDIIDTLFAILPITDKRNFIRCNHKLNLKTILMAHYENEFMARIQKLYEFHLPTYLTRLKKLEKYTLELIYDNYEHLIPNTYICEQNILCNNYPFMYFYCAKPNNIPLIKRLSTYNPKNNVYITRGAACNGHLDVLKWARENNYVWDHYTCSYAARNGHLHVLKWARENGCE